MCDIITNSVKTIRALELRINEMTKENTELKKKQETCHSTCKVTSPFLQQLIAAHLRNKDVPDPYHRKWTFNDKLFSLNIYRRSVRAFEFLHAQDQTCFPTERTVLRLSSDISMDVGMNDIYLDALETRNKTLPEIDKFVILNADEISLRPILVYDINADRVIGFQNYGDDASHLNNTSIANKALVFMIQGINKPYKQPLVCYHNYGGINGENLTELSLYITKKLKKIGFIVKGFVTDQAKANCKAISLLTGTTDNTKTYFELDNEKIFVLPDAPHEIKCIRNNFLGDFNKYFNTYSAKKREKKKYEYPGNKIVLNDITGNYRDITLLYEMKSIDCCNDWNDSMIFPNSREKMRVTPAARLLSQTTANDLRTNQFIQAKKNKYGESLADEDTATVVEILNDVFDCMNGPSSKDKKKSASRCLVSQNSEHIVKWEKYSKMFQECRFIKWTGQHFKPPTVSNIILTLNSMRDLWEEMSSKYSLETLNLRRLHQDALENFFSWVRRSLGSNNNPTAIDMTRIVKTLILSKFSTNSTKGANCETDDGYYLINQTDWFESAKKYKIKNSTSQNLSQNECIIDADDSYDVDSGENNINTEVNQAKKIPVLHIPDYESDSEDIIELIYVDRELMPLIIARKLLRNIKLDNCKQCSDCFIKYHHEENRTLFEPSSGLKTAIVKAHQAFSDSIVPKFNIKNIGQTTILLFERSIKLDWLKCQDHQQKLKATIFQVLARTLIERQCALLNRRYKSFDSKTKNTVKIAQMAQINRSSGDDDEVTWDQLLVDDIDQFLVDEQNSLL